MRNTLYKAYLDDFASFCEKLGGTTSEVMSDLLAFEADRRALNITLNRWVGAASVVCLGWSG
jgi:V-type H+-transporting ATPase subunit d